MESLVMGASKKHWQAVVVGASAGGLKAISSMLSVLPESFPLPIFVVQHIHAVSTGYLATYFARQSSLPVHEGEDKMPVVGGHVYVAPPNYHMLVEDDRTLSLSVDERVNFSRPSIDVLFESAADVYRDTLVGVILTGANADGAKGVARIRELGGLVLVQSPEEAEVPLMPTAAIEIVCPDGILTAKEIGRRISQMMEE
jgi:two-component system chemotaxis response regulator CheB